MRRPACPATAQHEADARPGRVGGECYGRLEKKAKNENGSEAAEQQNQSFIRKKTLPKQGFP